MKGILLTRIFWGFDGNGEVALGILEFGIWLGRLLLIDTSVLIFFDLSDLGAVFNELRGLTE